LYKSLPQKALPESESLKDTVDRVLPYWQDVIVPQVIEGNRIIVVAHANSLRAILKHLKQLSDAEIVGLNIPTASPLVCEFDQRMNLERDYYL
jgi:2,3-bisphosphoglycerate-dependent phosphoglycerate mutase